MHWPSLGISISNDEAILAGIVLGSTVFLALASSLLLKFLLNLGELKNRAWARALIGPLRTLCFWGLLLLGINLAIDGIESISQNHRLATNIEKTLALAWVIFLAACSVKFIIAFFRIEVARHDVGDPSRMNRLILFRRLTTGSVLAVALMFALGVLGVDTKPFLAGGAFSGVIIGLALQESMGNVFSGLLFTWDAAVRIGDLVQLSGGKEGFVENVGWRSTSIRMTNNTLLIIPNRTLAGDTIVNLSRPNPIMTVSLDGTIPPGEDLDKIEAAMMKVGRQIQEEYRQGQDLEEPHFRWREMVDVGLVFRLFVPIGSVVYRHRARSHLVREMYAALGGIGLPAEGKPVRITAIDPP